MVETSSFEARELSGNFPPLFQRPRAYAIPEGSFKSFTTFSYFQMTHHGVCGDRSHSDVFQIKIDSVFSPLL